MEQINLSIVPMTLSDLDKIKENLETGFDDFWNYNILKNELENKSSTYFCIKENDSIVGFSGITIVLDEADITNIVIKKTHRNKRIRNFTFKKYNFFL